MMSMRDGSRCFQRWLILLSLMVSIAVGACGGQDDPAPGPETSPAGAPADATNEGDEHTVEEHSGEENPGLVEIDPGQLATTKFETVPARSIAFAPRIQTTGQVTLNEERTEHLVARVSGWIEQQAAFLNDPVRPGQALAVLYSPDYLTAQTELLQARDRVDRVRGQDDPERAPTAEGILEAARRRLLLLGAGEEAVQRLLETGEPTALLSLASPLSGTVVETEATQGSAVEPGDELFRVSDLSTVWVEADVYENDLRHVRPGNAVRVQVQAYPDESFAGTIARVGDVLDARTRTVKARAVISNSNARLKAGMFTEIEILASGAGTSGLAVPLGAIQRLDDEPVVFVPEGEGRYEVREVALGPEEDGWVRVDRGLEEGETVVTEGSFLLKSELLKGTFEAGHGH